jgi:tetrahydromethanopterin S-methyltransferase subunit B
VTTEQAFGIVGAIISALVAMVLRDHDRRMTKVETRQDLVDVALKPLSEAIVKLTVQVEALQKTLERERSDRTVTSNFRALDAESTGPHRVVP